jgi:ubiquinol-cytochrome c reductase cytochrome b subunit
MKERERAMETMKRIAQWLEDRTGLIKAIKPIAEHPVPPKTGWWYVFGSATLFTFILQVATGITLAFLYAPSTEGAYQSLQYITNEAFLGGFLRGLHFFGASAMVVLVFVHLSRVFLFGSFKFPRELNWLAGVVLLFATLLMAFSGEILRWDQNAVWGLMVGVYMAGRTPFIGRLVGRFLLGGETLGAQTLSRFFAYHVFWVPALLGAVIGLHLYLVLRHGISEPPEPGRAVHPETYREEYEEMLQKKGVPFWPDAGWRDAVFGASVIFLIALLALVVGALPLVGPPNPSTIQAEPRPDWEFLWYFAVLALIPPAVEPWVMIGAPLIIIIVMILIPLIGRRGERSPARRPWAVVAVLIFVLAFFLLTWEGVLAPWSPRFEAQPLPAEVVNSTDSQVVTGADLFYKRGCEYCHTISGYGGLRGPDLTHVGSRLNATEMQIRILNGGHNMPAFGAILTPEEVNALVAFLQSRQLAR